MKRIKSAPFRRVTIRDIMDDLPPVENSATAQICTYDSKPGTQFQRLIRRSPQGTGGGNEVDTVRHHASKVYPPLVEERMRRVPLIPGSDWRDLPNISVKLKNGVMTAKLAYTHHDPKSGKGPGNTLRGVCHCVEGESCWGHL